MMRRTRALLLGLLLSLLTLSAARAAPLPRFTEEREAAAMFFVKKQLPELLPLLEDLKRHHRAQYEQEIREIFQVTEILADLTDDPKRHELELRFWRTENRALVVVARLSTSRVEERAKLQQQLQELARELVEMDLQSTEMHARNLERDAQEAREELQRLRENLDKTVRDRYENLLDKVKRRKK